MPRLLRPRGRLLLWIASAVALVAGQLMWIMTRRGGWMLASLSCLTLIALLLATTPSDALKLPRRVSEVLILGVAVVLQVTALLAADAPAATATPSAFRAAGAVTIVAAAAVVLLLLRRRGHSAWWVVLLAWNPLLLLAAERW